MRNHSLPPHNFERIVPAISLDAIPIAGEPVLAPGPSTDGPGHPHGATEAAPTRNMIPASRMNAPGLANPSTGTGFVSVDAAPHVLGINSAGNYSCNATRRCHRPQMPSPAG